MQTPLSVCRALRLYFAPSGWAPCGTTVRVRHTVALFPARHRLLRRRPDRFRLPIIAALPGGSILHRASRPYPGSLHPSPCAGEVALRPTFNEYPKVGSNARPTGAVSVPDSLSGSRDEIGGDGRRVLTSKINQHAPAGLRISSLYFIFLSENRLAQRTPRYGALRPFTSAPRRLSTC